MLRLWNINLIVGTFVLTILGTFLTRSGIISSVHAFTTGTIGYYFLALHRARAARRRWCWWPATPSGCGPTGRLDSAASRETVFLLNNLFLTAFMLTVLVGTLFPLVAEAVRGVKVSVGGPFFNRMSLPIIAALLFLMGVGPALPWKSCVHGRAAAKLIPPIAGAVVLAVVARHHAYCAISMACSRSRSSDTRRQRICASTGSATRARHARARRNLAGRAVLRLIAGNRRRYGGYIAHFGVFFVALGITASSSLRTEHEATLKPGETMTDCSGARCASSRCGAAKRSSVRSSARRWRCSTAAR